MVVGRLDFRVFLNHSLKCHLSQGSPGRSDLKVPSQYGKEEQSKNYVATVIEEVEVL